MIEKLANFVTDQLRENGWSRIDGSLGNSQPLGTRMLEIASLLGTPVGARVKDVLVETLTPTGTDQARTRSLSRIYSTGSFPLHTDTAHWPTPCRYVVDRMCRPGRRRPSNRITRHD